MSPPVRRRRLPEPIPEARTAAVPAVPPFILAAFFGAALFAAAVRAAAGGENSLPWDRQLSLDIWGGGLADAIREIRLQTGVEAAVYPPDLPAAETAGNLHLVSGKVNLAAVMEALARRYSFRYRLSAAGRLELSRSYGWIGGEPELTFLELDALVPPQGMEPRAMAELLGEFIKVLPGLPGDGLLAVERNPTPEHPGSLRAVAALPPVLAGYLRRATACLAGDPGDAAGGGLLARRYPAEWERLLGRQADAPAERDLRRLLAGVAAQTGLVFILQPPLPSSLSAPLSGRMTLGQFTSELAARLKLGKRAFLAAGAVLFEPSSLDGELEVDDSVREFFWTGLTVTGLAARRAAAAAGGGKALLARIRREIFPSLWRDPVCALVYSETTGRLAVTAPANAAAAAAELVAELSR